LSVWPFFSGIVLFTAQNSEIFLKQNRYNFRNFDHNSLKI